MQIYDFVAVFLNVTFENRAFGVHVHDLCVTAETCVGVLLCLLQLRDCVVNLMAVWLLREYLTQGNNVPTPIHLLINQPPKHGSMVFACNFRFSQLIHEEILKAVRFV